MYSQKNKTGAKFGLFRMGHSRKEFMMCIIDVSKIYKQIHFSTQNKFMRPSVRFEYLTNNSCECFLLVQIVNCTCTLLENCFE